LKWKGEIMLKTVGNPSTRYGDQVITDGNLVIGTAGKGIDFSATPGLGTSELLSDYEEGTWTPDFSAWTTAPSLIFATYTKIGRQVTVSLYANDGVNAGAQAIGGLPFVSSSTSASAIYGGGSNWPNISGSILQSSSQIQNIPTINQTGAYWQITATYFV